MVTIITVTQRGLRGEFLQMPEIPWVKDCENTCLSMISSFQLSG